MTPGNIRKLRKALGETQPEFAARLGLGSLSAVSRWENGHTRPHPVHRRAMERLAADHGLQLEGGE